MYSSESQNYLLLHQKHLKRVAHLVEMSSVDHGFDWPPFVGLSVFDHNLIVYTQYGCAPYINNMYKKTWLSKIDSLGGPQ